MPVKSPAVMPACPKSGVVGLPEGEHVAHCYYCEATREVVKKDRCCALVPLRPAEIETAEGHALQSCKTWREAKPHLDACRKAGAAYSIVRQT